MFNCTTSLTQSELKSAIIRDPLIIKPETTVMDAIAQMSAVRAICDTDKLDEVHLEARSSCVLIVEAGRLLGIFTERDVVRLCSQRRCLENLAIREVMIHPVVSLHESEFTDLFFAVNLLQQYRIRHIPILDEEERVVGLLTNESLRQTSRSVDLLRLRLVSEVMTCEVICAAPDSSMLAIAQLLTENRVSSVMIVQLCECPANPQKIPVGIVTERDIVQFQALGLNLETCQVQTVMSTPIFAVRPDYSLRFVQQIMEQRLIRRLAVTGEQGELLGIVTQSSLLQALNPLEVYKLAQMLEERVVRLETEKVQLLENRTVELEQQVADRTASLKAKAGREQILSDISRQIRSSLSLQTILDTTVEQVRQLLGCDRVNIWHFEAEWESIVMAESTTSSRSLLGKRIQEICFQQRCAELYRYGRIRIVPDIYTTEMTDCHRELLIRLQTRAKILVPLLCGDELWGLLNVTESQHAREWQTEEIELLQGLSVHLAIAIQQATTHQKLQEQLIALQEGSDRLQESEQRYIALNQNLEAKVEERTAELQAREAQLQKISERLALSLKSAAIGCWDWDIGENTIFWDERMYELYGVTKTTDSRLVYDTWANGLHPDDRTNTEILVQQAVLGQAEYDTEFRVIHPDGSIHFIKAYGVVVRDAEGNPQKMIGVHFDISDRKKAEEIIRQQAEREKLLREITQRIRQSLDLQTIFDIACQDIRQVIQADRVGIFKFYPESNFNDGEFVAESVVDEFPSVIAIRVHDQCFGENYSSLYALGRSYVVDDIYNSDMTTCHTDILAQFHVRANVIMPLLCGAELWGLLCIHQCATTRHWEQSEIDFTQQLATQLAIAIQQASLVEQLQQELAERQQAELKLTQSNQQLAISNQELARATRLKDEFLANMSHELRTPLNAILGMTEGLQEGVFGMINDKQFKALETIERSSSHLLDLINDILDVAKIEAGQIKLDCTAISVAALCQSSLVFIKQQALQKRIQVEIKIPLNLPDLFVDERRIRQVLINLLNNAVKFTPETGRISLEVTQVSPDISTVQNFLQIAVIDTGIGIMQENINKLFQPFIQIDSALNRQYEGTGLGLALVKKIVELHGGRVGLTSELGVGSCFTIELPCTPSTPSSPELIRDLLTTPNSELDFANAEEAASLAPVILLAEDNEANIKTFSSYLSAKGYGILLATNGEQALELATIHQPDLILMDIQMPGIDGLEAIRQIRLDPELVNIPIVALTALAMTGDRDRCLQAGANDYLTKPVKLKQLATTIQQLLMETKK
ncbi:multi-sensor hybrid histidine kinase [Trichormus variabilis ATCC 29413]|uniref:histidine kinase n=2 Tax=Anabaena variabilis TaxID=264691 RepID=Q3M3Y8_TRIV2|nr:MULTISPECIES: GAF domain-containing protein [Nostocaceae]ABA24298.1 multi-sensor hybrid histidine kinase [Trichormus variabilis ATCC 29413]